MRQIYVDLKPTSRDCHDGFEERMIIGVEIVMKADVQEAVNRSLQMDRRTRAFSADIVPLFLPSMLMLMCGHGAGDMSTMLRHRRQV
jgi:hypothetical protein